MLPSDVSVSLPPIVTPHRPRFTEYAAPYGGIGSLRSSRYFSCSGRLNALVAHRRENRQLRRERAQRDFEAHLIVAGGRAAVRHDLGAELARVFGNRLRLHHALGADAQRIHLAALHVAHDQVLDHLVEVRLLAPRPGCDPARRARGRAAPAPWPPRASMPPVSTVTVMIGRPIGRAQPRHQERGVEAAGEGEQNRLGAGRKCCQIVMCRSMRVSLRSDCRKCREDARAACAARDRLRWR